MGVTPTEDVEYRNGTAGESRPVDEEMEGATSRPTPGQPKVSWVSRSVHADP